MQWIIVMLLQNKNKTNTIEIEVYTLNIYSQKNYSKCHTLSAFHQIVRLNY